MTLQFMPSIWSFLTLCNVFFLTTESTFKDVLDQGLYLKRNLSYLEIEFSE